MTTRALSGAAITEHRARLSFNAALDSRDADAWDVAGDAWEDIGRDDWASLCREMASLTREGKNPSLVRMGETMAIVHDHPAPLASNASEGQDPK